MLDKRVGMNWFEIGNPYKCSDTDCDGSSCDLDHEGDDYQVVYCEDTYLEILKQNGVSIDD